MFTSLVNSSYYKCVYTYDVCCPKRHHWLCSRFIEIFMDTMANANDFYQFMVKDTLRLRVDRKTFHAKVCVSTTCFTTYWYICCFDLCCNKIRNRVACMPKFVSWLQLLHYILKYFASTHVTITTEVETVLHAAWDFVQITWLCIWLTLIHVVWSIFSPVFLYCRQMHIFQRHKNPIPARKILARKYICQFSQFSQFCFTYEE